MTSIHRPTNLLALAVLTHLYEKPRHPYELATTMKERGKEHSIRLNYGSLYTVIEALVRDGYIRAMKTLREGRRPEKTVYEIKPLGKTLMLEWMKDLVRTPVKEYPQFEAALSLLPVLPPDEAMTLLGKRVSHLNDLLGNLKRAERARAEMKLPRLFSIESEFYEEMTKSELRFCVALLKDLKDDAGGITSTWERVRESVLGSQKILPKTASNKSNRNKG